MEFLRFGSSIPGSYWGCCAMCIIQNFKFDPDAKYAIELVSGDGGQPLGDNFAGKTYREVFETRLRVGTFNTNNMPNHGFLAILTDWQVSNGYGAKWLKILKDNGFEFIRTVDNSVYSGASLKKEGVEGDSSHKNYLFGLFRNIGSGAVDNPFMPPKEWTNLEGGVEEIWDYLKEGEAVDPFEKLQKSRDEIHRAKWEETSPTKFYKRAELEKEGIPIWLAGRRSTNPQELANTREERQKADTGAKPTPAPFAAVAVKL